MARQRPGAGLQGASTPWDRHRMRAGCLLVLVVIWPPEFAPALGGSVACVRVCACGHSGLGIMSPLYLRSFP